MPITNFQPDIWSAVLLQPFKKTLVYGSDIVTNRDYEGEVSRAGKSVKVTSIARPTITTYVPGTPMTREVLNDTSQTMNIDRFRAFNFEVDDVNARQAAGDILTTAMEEAAYGLALDVDSFVAGLHPGITLTVTGVSIAGSPAASAVVDTARAVSSLIGQMNVALDAADVPRINRYIILPPWLLERLNGDPALMTAAGDSTFQNGFAGTLRDGTRLLMSNNVPEVVGPPNTFTVTAGVSRAITMAAQIDKIEAYRPESSFSDAVKGLLVYGARVVRPTAAVKCVVTRT